MKKLILLLSLGLLATLSLSTQAAPMTSATSLRSAQTTAVVGQQEFWLGVNTAQGDVAYFQQAVNDGSMTYDQYQDTIRQMQEIALNRSNDSSYSQEDQDYYRGYYQGLAFA